MKTMKRLVIFLTCFVVLLSTFTFNYSAVEYDPYTGEEMIFDGDCAYYTPYKPLEYEPIETFRLSAPNYPNFDVNKLPWVDMPTYVQEIMSAERVPLGRVDSGEYTGEYKLPFISVIANGTTVTVLAGYNLCVGTYFQTATQRENNTPYRTFLVAIKYHEQLYKNAVCYYATYNQSNYTLNGAWRALEAVAVADNFVRYYNFNYDTPGQDYYFYGVSGMYQDRVLQTLRINASDTDSFPQYVMVNNPSSGFASGTITYIPEVWEGYITSFSPPSAEQQQAATSKGIWETLKEVLNYIKNLPSNIANSIKSFFTSLGDRISGFFDNLSANISGYFTTLKNYLLYFQDTKPEHVNPFNDILTDIQTFFDEQMFDISDFRNSLTSTLNNVVTYIESGSGVVNTFLTAVPVLSSFVTFFVVFCIVRKVIGR